MNSGIAIFLCLVLASPLSAAEAAQSLNSSGQTPLAVSSIHIYSDFKGRLYLNGRPAGKLGALSKTPLEIKNLTAGNYHLTELLSRHDFIKCDVAVTTAMDTYVYLRWDSSKVGNTMESIGYVPDSRNWLMSLIIGGGLLLTAAIVVLAVGLSKSQSNTTGSVAI